MYVWKAQEQFPHLCTKSKVVLCKTISKRPPLDRMTPDTQKRVIVAILMGQWQEPTETILSYHFYTILLWICLNLGAKTFLKCHLSQISSSSRTWAGYCGTHENTRFLGKTEGKKTAIYLYGSCLYLNGAVSARQTWHVRWNLTIVLGSIWRLRFLSDEQEDKP